MTREVEERERIWRLDYSYVTIEVRYLSYFENLLRLGDSEGQKGTRLVWSVDGVTWAEGHEVQWTGQSL